MTLDEFLEITNKLEKFYNKEYSQEQRKEIYQEFKEETQERYSRVQQEVLRSCKFFPTLADFIEIKNRVLPHRKEEEKKKVKCKLCDGTGMIFYKKFNQELGQEYQYVARCICQNAEGMSKIIPSAEEVGLIKR